jgi:hypothetical protein
MLFIKEVLFLQMCKHQSSTAALKHSSIPNVCLYKRITVFSSTTKTNFYYLYRFTLKKLKMNLTKRESLIL